MREAGIRRVHLELERRRSRIRRDSLERDRKHLGHRRVGEATFGECGAAAQREQTSAALAHEIGEHAELVAGEERRLDAAEDDSAILKQLFAREGKASHHLEAVTHAEAQKFFFGAAHQAYDLEAAVVLHRAPQEGELGARLAVEKENARGAWPNFEHGVVRIVLGDRLARDRPRANGEPIRGWCKRRHAQADTRDVARIGERDLFRGDDAPVRFDRDRRLLAARAANADGRFDQHRGSGEHAGGRRDALHRYVAREAFLAHAYRVDRHPTRPQRKQCGPQIAAAVVRAIGHDDHPGEGHAGQILTRHVERAGEIGTGAPAGERRSAGRRACIGGEAKGAEGEALRELLHQRAGVGEDLLHRAESRAAIHVLEAHAARVVEHHGEHVALRDGAGHHNGGAEQAGQHDGDGGRTDGAEHDAIEPVDRLDAVVHHNDQRQRGDGGDRDQQRRDGGSEYHVTALEHARRILEEKSEEGFERSSHSGSQRWKCTVGPFVRHRRRRSVHLIYAGRLPMVRHHKAT